MNTPYILFFSGGTALRDVAAQLTQYPVQSIHLVTTFDSGGSSGILRRTFAMPAVGDIRARTLALASAHRPENRLYAFRLPEDLPAATQHLHALQQGSHPLLADLDPDTRQHVCDMLQIFFSQCPQGFDPRGASVGNLILTALYLQHHGELTAAAQIFGDITHAKGIVRPVSEDNAHLCAELADGTFVCGQHRFTGKATSAINAPIRHVHLSSSPDAFVPMRATLAPSVQKLIQQADLICFPVGSFYSSVIANLLPEGVTDAIIKNPCPKVFLPNPGPDPELFGHTLKDQLEVLNTYAPTHPKQRVILLDPQHGTYTGGIPHAWLKAHKTYVKEIPLFSSSTGKLQPETTCEALICLAQQGCGR